MNGDHTDKAVFKVLNSNKEIIPCGNSLLVLYSLCSVYE